MISNMISKFENHYWKMSIPILSDSHVTIACLQLKNSQKKTSNRDSLLTVEGVIVIGAVLLFTYLMWYVTPEENIETVKVITVTEAGCIAEILDGFSVNIGDCQAQSGEYTVAKVDQKTKERAALMNPTR